MDVQKGITFAEGILGDIAISSFQIFQNSIIVDTRSSTDNSVRVFDYLLQFAKEKNGATVVRLRYHLTSQITFRSDLNLSLINPFLKPIADRLSLQLSESLNDHILFEPTAVMIGPQTWSMKIVPNAFTLERRTETPFNVPPRNPLPRIAVGNGDPVIRLLLLGRVNRELFSRFGWIVAAP